MKVNPMTNPDTLHIYTEKKQAEKGKDGEAAEEHDKDEKPSFMRKGRYKKSFNTKGLKYIFYESYRTETNFLCQATIIGSLRVLFTGTNVFS